MDRHDIIEAIVFDTEKPFKETPYRSVFSFGRVSEGRPFSSDCTLTRLPLEILEHIMVLIAWEDLGNFALANRDCHQLARSRQFAEVKLDYSDSAIQILDRLAKEHGERIQNNGKTVLPSIGACVRSIIIATNPKYLARRHDLELFDGFYDLHEDRRRDEIIDRAESVFDAEVPVIDSILGDARKVNKACNSFLDHYMPQIWTLLSNPLAMPNLQSLTWNDRTPVDKHLFTSIASLPLHDLSFQRPMVARDLEPDLSSEFASIPCNWTLKSLNLGTQWYMWSNREWMSAKLLLSLLHLSAPTLTSLDWHCTRHPPLPMEVPFSDTDRPVLKRLQKLRIGRCIDCNSQWLEVLIQPGASSPIRSLELDIFKDKMTDDFFRRCGCLPMLETLVLHCLYFGFDQHPPSLHFLNVNCHIRKLAAVFYAVEASFIEEELLPLLNRSFKNLTSLSLVFNATLPDIAQRDLDQISSLNGLEQLCLGIGTRNEVTTEWATDHSKILQCVAKLRSLHKLAICGDNYPSCSMEHVQLGKEGYYDFQVLRTTQLPAMSAEERDEWEIQHRQDMEEVAKRYMDVLPNLEWIYVGQHQMRIDRSISGDSKPVPLHAKRQLCWGYLDEIFGWG